MNAKIDIILDQTITVADGFLTGLVEIKADSQIEMSELLIAFLGKELLSGKDKRERPIVALRNVLSRQTTLLVGKTTFNFTFSLPNTLPSSFHSMHCDIAYSIEVYVAAPGGQGCCCL